MNLLDEIPIGILEVLEGDIPQDTSVVDEDVDGTESLDGSLNDLLAVLNGIVVGNGLSAILLDLLNNNICSLWNRRLLAVVLVTRTLS